MNFGIRGSMIMSHSGKRLVKLHRDRFVKLQPLVNLKLQHGMAASLGRIQYFVLQTNMHCSTYAFDSMVDHPVVL
jgi:hypothetical protein